MNKTNKVNFALTLVQLITEQDVSLIVSAVSKLLPMASSDEVLDYIWPHPPLSVIDCVLSLNRNYKDFCKPRVKRFAERHPEVINLDLLQKLINRYPSPFEFSKEELDYKDKRRSQTLLGVTDFLINIQERFDGEAEKIRLLQWAITAQPQDFKSLRIHGFGLSGFQYLRMHFGAQTVKPDVHICHFVRDVIGRRLNEISAILLMERAAKQIGPPLRAVDNAIWKSYSSTSRIEKKPGRRRFCHE
jgi:hypothetical protein